MSINILNKIKDNLSKKFDKYDYNFKYRFMWIKFHKKKKKQWKERTLLKLQKQNMQLQNFDDEI